jgi:hypothetical protein
MDVLTDPAGNHQPAARRKKGGMSVSAGGEWGSESGPSCRESGGNGLLNKAIVADVAVNAAEIERPGPIVSDGGVAEGGLMPVVSVHAEEFTDDPLPVAA